MYQSGKSKYAEKQEERQVKRKAYNGYSQKYALDQVSKEYTWAGIRE